MRIYQYAKQIGLSPKHLIEICENAGIKGKTYVSGLKDDEISVIDKYIKKSRFTGKSLVCDGTETVGQIASKLGISAGDIIKQLSDIGITAKINDTIGVINIKKLCEVLGIPVEIKKTKASYIRGAAGEIGEEFVSRAPIVTVMGHVDHGKTTILDFIRRSNIAKAEFGQITQKIGAYKVHIKEGDIVFIDTPGHEIFTAMRARGAQLTDIVVLVVAADDGVKQQTIEAINHCKAANVPIIVAINKIDKPNANPDSVKKQLSGYGLVPEEWGGQTVFLNVSGITGQNIKELLEIILLMGEMMDLKANPERPAEGVVLEGYLHKQKGPIMHLLVQNGTLNIGDFFVCGASWGKVRAMFDENGARLEKAGPSTPVEILGANSVAVPGDKFMVVGSEADAKKYAEQALQRIKSSQEKVQKQITLEDIQNQIIQGSIKELNIILKTDSIGSQEAIKASIEKLTADSEKHEVVVHLIHWGLGAVNESDVLLASCSQAIIIGYNVGIDSSADKQAKEKGVEIRIYRLVYDLIEDIKNILEGMKKPQETEIMIGQALVKQVFKAGKNQTVAGCLVVEGKIIRGVKVKIIREGKFIFEGFLTSLKRFKNSVREVGINTECGIGVADFNDFQPGDIIQAYEKASKV